MPCHDLVVEVPTPLMIAEMLAAFGESADPSYAGDDMDGLVKANGAKRLNVTSGR